jgi:hypothetical protein
MKNLLFLSSCVMLAGCGFRGFAPEPVRVPEMAVEATRPVARPQGGVKAPPAGARTAAQFDTTTAADRAAALEAAKSPLTGGALGRTVASLGDPVQPGLWLETPLVETVRMGRVVYLATGTAAVLELQPIAGPEGAGSRLSLAAMRLLEAPLTGLPELEVFSE